MNINFFFLCSFRLIIVKKYYIRPSILSDLDPPLLIGGADESHLEGVVSPILLGSVDAGTIRYGISAINSSL